MNKEELIICVTEHLDKYYASKGHKEIAIQLVEEYLESIRTDERAKMKEQTIPKPYIIPIATIVTGSEESFKTDLAKECKYLLTCRMGKKKSLEHLIKILEKEAQHAN